MLSMELLDKLIPLYVAWWAPHVLLLCIPVLMAWFPGANARQRGHERAQAVSTISWLLPLSMAALILTSRCELLTLLPAYLMLWTGIVVWSYGRHELKPALGTLRGFEIFLRPLNLSLELATAE